MKFSRITTGLARLWAALKSHPVELLILFDQLSIKRTDSVNSIIFARIDCALSK